MSGPLVSLYTGALVASALHAAIPTHWLPFVLMGKLRGWGIARILQVTAVAGACHIALTILLGVGLAFLGTRAIDLVGGTESLSRIAAGLLTAAGIFYVILHLVSRGHHRHHFPIAAADDHPHDSAHHTHDHGHRLAEGATVGTLIAVMTISPCEAVIPVFPLAQVQGGWRAVGILSAVLLAGTVGGMLLFVALGHRGVELVKSEFLEHNERLILGLILAILGIVGLVLHT